MANETIITVVGNLVGEPELRFTQSGAAVANFTVASTPRFPKTGSGTMGTPCSFMRCNIWRGPAENVAESLTKGDRVIVTGRLRQRSKDGERRTVTELDVDEVGPSLRYEVAKLTTARPGNGGVAMHPAQGVPSEDDEPPF